ncbi:MAG: helix-turn-helix transcriptional regulator [Anaerolineae bacterium]|nr:helix-turn-helix transcriptional regulator [Anaerolineae bacterium]
MAQLTPDETLLGLIAARPQHGYDLLDSFRDPNQLGKVWTLSTSQLYAVLKRLEQQGLTQVREVVTTDAPARTEHTLTDAGRDRLAAWLDEEHPSASVRRVRVEFLSRLYVARLLNLSTIELIQRQKRVCRERRHHLMIERGETQPGVSFLVVDLEIAQLDAILQWIDRCEIVPKEEGDP